jgi:hypothetical protein
MKYIKYIHDLIDLLTKKGKSGYFPRVDIDTAVYTASKQLFDEEYKKYEINQEVSDSLKVFQTDPTSLSLDGAGKVNKPADYLHVTSLRDSTNKDIDVIAEAFIGTRLDDEICPPEVGFSICVFYKTYLQFYPIGTTGVKITYLKNPVQPVYAYTVVNGREVYDDTNSVDVEWNVSDQSKVTMRALAILGVALSDSELAQFGIVEAKING